MILTLLILLSFGCIFGVCILNKNYNSTQFNYIDTRPSAIRKKYPLKDKLTDDDLVVISHKIDNGYSSTAITLGELKKYIKGE